MFHEILLTLLGYGGPDLLIEDPIHHTYYPNPSYSTSTLFTEAESQQLSSFLSLGWYSKYLQQYLQKYLLHWHGNYENNSFSAYLSALCLGIHEIHEVPSFLSSSS